MALTCGLTCCFLEDLCFNSLVHCHVFNKGKRYTTVHRKTALVLGTIFLEELGAKNQ